MQHTFASFTFVFIQEVKLELVNYKYKCQGITWDIQSLYIFYFLTKLLWNSTYNRENQISLSSAYNEKQVTELDTVNLLVYKIFYLIQMKAQKTTIIKSVMVQQLSFPTVLSALSKLSITRCTLPLFTQWHHKIFKYFIYILSPIYIYVLQRGPNTWHFCKFYLFAWVFLHFSQKAVFAFTQFNL